MTRTEWFPGSIRPVRSGEYETKLFRDSYVHMRHYDVSRDQWYWIASNGELMKSDFGHGVFREAVWRGVAK